MSTIESVLAAHKHGVTAVSVRQGDWLAANSDRPAADFWPEVSSRYSLENPIPMDPQNSRQRIRFEVFLILAGAGMLVAAVAFWLPMTS